jgi:hypothetical protein
VCSILALDFHCYVVSCWAWFTLIMLVVAFAIAFPVCLVCVVFPVFLLVSAGEHCCATCTAGNR